MANTLLGVKMDKFYLKDKSYFVTKKFLQQIGIQKVLNALMDKPFKIVNSIDYLLNIK